jgi:mRNA interferase RelE/StbE
MGNGGVCSAFLSPPRTWPYTGGMKRVILMPEARKTLSRLPRPTAERILDKIELYADDPQALANNVKRLKGDQGLRLRVGDWRVLFDEDAATVTVRGVRPRGSAYE